MAFSGLACRANPHCTAESLLRKGYKYPLRGLIFYHAAVRSFFSRRRPVLQNVHPRLHGVHFLHLVQKGSHNYARVSSQLTDSQWQRS